MKHIDERIWERKDSPWTLYSILLFLKYFGSSFVCRVTQTIMQLLPICIISITIQLIPSTVIVKCCRLRSIIKKGQCKVFLIEKAARDLKHNALKYKKRGQLYKMWFIKCVLGVEVWEVVPAASKVPCKCQLPSSFLVLLSLFPLFHCAQSL